MIGLIKAAGIALGHVQKIGPGALGPGWCCCMWDASMSEGQLCLLMLLRPVSLSVVRISIHPPCQQILQS
jgi:hypothetical protein